jgi:hypothetical protein
MKQPVIKQSLQVIIPCNASICLATNYSINTIITPLAAAMSQTQVRQRFSQLPSSNRNPNHHHQMKAQPGDALAASTLLQSNPTHSGQVYKLNIPFYYTLLPLWFQGFLRYIPFSETLGLVPSWKKRYLIQIGKYIYRYQTNGINGTENKMKLKGTPMAIDTIQCQRNQNTSLGIQSNSHDEIISFARDVPSSCHGFFSITSNGDTRYYAVSTPEEATVWINSMREGRQSCIERNLGHDKRPYPESWRYIDTMGEDKYKRKNRIKDKLDRNKMKELEMMEFIGGAGMRTGHFG